MTEETPAPQEPLFTPKLINAMQHAIGSYTRNRVTRDEATLCVLLSLRDSGYELIERRPLAPVQQARYDIAALEEWIEGAFVGYGIALRREDEPLMSMAVAKGLVRRAVIECRPPAPDAALREALRPLANLCDPDDLVDEPNSEVLCYAGLREITLGDIRRAHAVLSATPPRSTS